MATSLEDLKARIQNTEAPVDWKSILIYGPTGAGKTSILYDAEDTLILDVENGTEVLKKDKYYGRKDYPSKADVLQVTSWEDIQGVYAALQNGDLKFTNVVLDSITDMRELCKDHVLAKEKRARIAADIASQQDYLVISERTRKMLRNFRALPLNLIVIARQYDHVDDESGAVKVKPAVGGKLDDDLPGMVSITVYMTVNKEGERIACFDLSGKYYAKDRTNRFPKVLKNPTWADFEKALPELSPHTKQEIEPENKVV